jgi:hypothetical protein
MADMRLAAAIRRSAPNAKRGFETEKFRKLSLPFQAASMLRRYVLIVDTDACGRSPGYQPIDQHSMAGRGPAGKAAE